MQRAPHAFWRWSLRVYRAPGVQAACLALQDGLGVDVNLLLLCGWQASRGASLDRRRLRQAIARVGGWQSQVVAPLRQARRAHKQLAPADAASAESAAALHKRLLGLELELEYAEQSMLADLAAGWPQPKRALAPRDAAAASLERYFVALDRPLAPADAAHVATLVEAFGKAPHAN